MKITLSKKAISPMVATVLLIAFTVAVGGVVSVWLQTFSRTTTGEVSEQTESEIYCSYAGISMSNLEYCSSYLFGRLENTKFKAIGNITVQIIYTNATTQTIRLCNNGSSCPSSLMSLEPGELKTFNISIDSSSYDTIRVYTNCSNVDDEVQSGQVTAC
jgi:flagellin-like protein